MNTQKRGIIVVHGIGDQRPGATLKDFADHYVAHVGGQSLNPGEVHWHQEDADNVSRDVARKTPVREPAKFPSFRQRAKVGDDELVFSEVYWADLSPTPTGLLGTIKGFFWVLFGLRHVVRGALAGEGLGLFRRALLKTIQWLSSAISWLVFGPISGIVLFLLTSLLIIALVFGIADMFPPYKAADGTAWRQWFEQPDIPVIASFLAALGLISAVVVRMMWQPLRLVGWPRRTLFWWVTISASVIALAPLLKPLFENEKIKALIKALEKVYPARKIVEDDPLALKSLAYGGFVIEMVHVIGLVVTVLLCLQLLLSVLAWLTVPKYRRAIELAYTSTYLLGTLYWIPVTFVLLFTERLIATNDYVQLVAKPLVTRLLFPAGPVWLVMAAIIVTFFIVGLYRRRWRRKYHDAASYEPGRPAARLIANPILIHVVNVISVIAISAVAWWIFIIVHVVRFEKEPGESTAFSSWMLKSMSDFLELLAGSTLILGGLLIILMMIFRPAIRTGLGLLLDITNHFRLGKPGLVQSVRSKGLGGGLKSRFLRADVFPLRQRTIDRIRIVTQDMIEHEGVTKISVVSHSQGTVFSIMAITQNPDLFKGLQAQLVTMGSPYTHLYQHYFPGHFSQRASERLPAVARWVNIFRTDDFVGTEVSCSHDHPQNFPVAPGGHLGYWSDKDVLEIINREAAL